jgi:cell division protein FtsI (penicillin-binding protein 3)
MLAVWALVIVGRLVHLQVLQYSDLSRQAREQQTQAIEIPATRGDIVDRNDRTLATTVMAPTIYARLTGQVQAEQSVGPICAALGDCTAASREKLREKLSLRGRWVSVKRHASMDQVDRIYDLDLPWIAFEVARKRVYPHGELAAGALGSFGDEPLGGLESKWNADLRGQPGRAIEQRDGNQVAFDTRVIAAPVEGSKVQLTLDIAVQEIVERELRAAVKENRAAGGSAVVMDVATGAILATAHYPTFDPNGPESPVSNPVVLEAYEAGSTMKAFTAAAALEAGVVTPDVMIDVSEGKIAVGRNRTDIISDVHNYGRLTFTDVLAKSSNVGMIKVARLLGGSRLTEFLRRLGFGSLTTESFALESRGKVYDASVLEKDDGALAHVAIGYQVSVTLPQMAAAMTAIANGGELLQPYLVASVTGNGTRRAFGKKVLRRVMQPGVALQVKSMLEKVAEDGGTAPLAKPAGYTVAGKTGTARKFVGKSYSTTKYYASFAGVVPSESPRFTIVVVVDSPDIANRYFGGQVAAPVFRRIAEGVLRYEGVPAGNRLPPVMVRREPTSRVHEQPVSGPVAPPATLAVTRPRADVDPTVPDLTGMSLNEVVVRLARLRLHARMVGDGLVVDQRPLPGTPIEAGTSATIWLGPRSQASRTSGDSKRP